MSLCECCQRFGSYCSRYLLLPSKYFYCHYYFFLRNNTHSDCRCDERFIVSHRRHVCSWLEIILNRDLCGCDLRLWQWWRCHCWPSGLLRHVDLKVCANVSNVYTASIFRVWNKSQHITTQHSWHSWFLINCLQKLVDTRLPVLAFTSWRLESEVWKIPPAWNTEFTHKYRPSLKPVFLSGQRLLAKAWKLSSW